VLFSGRNSISERKSSRKLARLGNVKVKSIITVIAAVLVVLYVASVGVSASQSNAPSPAAVTVTRRITTTVTKTSTTTITAGAQALSGEGTLYANADNTTFIFDNGGATSPDCQVTFSIRTGGFNVAQTGGTTGILIEDVVVGGGIEQTTITSGTDTYLPGTTISTPELGFYFHFPAGNPSDYFLEVFYSWTAICPS